MKQLICLTCCLLIGQTCLVSQVNAKSPYELDFWQDAGLSASGLMVYLAAKLQKDAVQSVNAAGLTRFERSDINPFDRFASCYDSRSADRASDITLNISLLPMIVMLIDSTIRNDILTVTVMALEVAAINEGLTGLSKTLFLRPRPLLFNAAADQAIRDSPESRFSFFSSHTSNSAAYCFFTAKVFNDYYPNSPLGPWVWGAAALLPAITGALRVAAGKHFPTDVLTGYAVGALFGYFIPVLHHKSAHRSGLSFGTDSNQGTVSVSLMYRW